MFKKSIFFKYLSITAAALSLCAARADAGDTPEMDVTGEIQRLRTELDNARMLLASHGIDPSTDIENEIKQQQAELDSANALLDFYGIKPYTYKFILKSSLHGGRFNADDNYRDGYNRNSYSVHGIFWDTKLTLKLNGKYSPYAGVIIGSGGGVYAGGYAGIERLSQYDNGVWITRSYGVNFGFSDSSHNEIPRDPSGGIHAIMDVAFNQKRIIPYITFGIRLGIYEFVYISFPIGFGMSFKI